MISNSIEEIKKGEQERLAAWIIDHVRITFRHISVESQEEFDAQTEKEIKWLTSHFEFISKVLPETIEYIAHGVVDEMKIEHIEGKMKLPFQNVGLNSLDSHE